MTLSFITVYCHLLQRPTTINLSSVIDEPSKAESDVKARIPPGAEATSVLVATVEELERPVTAFVRLARGAFLGNMVEVIIPVRFMFVIMGPPSDKDYFEVGRSLATLMSDKVLQVFSFS